MSVAPESVVATDVREPPRRDAAAMTETAVSQTTPSETSGDQLAERLFGAGIAALELLTVHVGVRLGLYDALRRLDGATTTELASAAGIDERYAREWLEQQAVAALLDVDDAAAGPDVRRYSLPSAFDAVLVDRDSLSYTAPVADFVASFAGTVDELVDAFRTGAGIPYERFGEAMRNGQGGFNRPLFANVLTQDWIPNALPGLHDRLWGGASPRIADIACGVGWSTIALAKAYPNALVVGIDSDVASIEDARKNAADAGVADRVTFRVHDATEPPSAGEYDAAFVFEALHDMARPVAALAGAREMLAPGGVCVVMDEKVADEFTAPGDDVERFMFAVSVLHCLPAGLAEQPSAGTGTMLRRSILQRYATEAGFATVETLPVEHDFFRLYRLTP